MKRLYPFIFSLLFLWVGCSSTQHMQSADELPRFDSLYLALPLIQDPEDLKDLIEDYPFQLPFYTHELNMEGVVRALVRIDSAGLPSNYQIIESVSPAVDSIAIDYINKAKYIPPSHINNINGPYAVQLLIPFYNSDCNKSESDSMPILEPGRHLDTPPGPVDGYGAIHQNIIYPQLAFDYGVEGTVILQVFIDSAGRAGLYNLLKPMGYGLDDAAIRAIRSVKWRPSTVDGKPRGAWISIPIVFKLH